MENSAFFDQKRLPERHHALYPSSGDGKHPEPISTRRNLAGQACWHLPATFRIQSRFLSSEDLKPAVKSSGHSLAQFVGQSWPWPPARWRRAILQADTAWQVEAGICCLPQSRAVAGAADADV